MVTFRGSKKRDVIKGSNGSDTILGFQGADDLYGLGGNDTVKGGSENDKLFGGLGNDKLFGDTGNDSLKGDSGNDTLTGGTGNDSLIGGTGTDTAIFATSWAAATITRSGSTTRVAGSLANGIDTVSQVELFKFANGTFTAAKVVNDAPVANADAGLSTTEDATLTLTPAQLLANDTDADTFLGDVLTLLSVQNPTNGTIAIVGGSIVFTPTPGFNGAASFTYTVRDIKGATSTATAQLTITNTNDPAVISGTATGNVAEDGTLTTGGTLSVADIDTGEAELQPVSAGTFGTNGYGTFEVSAAGVWTYALNNAHASVQALPAGVTLTDTITVLSEDGTASQALTVTITGANDGAVISGTATGNVAEDGTLTTGGTLSVADIDTGEAELQPVSAGTLGTNGYGTFEVSAAGVWTYALNNAHASVQALPAGVTLTDTITVLSEDGTASQALTVTITGANDGAVISGTATGNVAEDGTLTTGGTLSVADIDTGEAELQPVSAGTLGTNGYGTFEVSAAGVWTYALNNAHASVQALQAGVTLTDTITVLSEDGTASQALTVTITGANDGAVISGTATGNVAEDGTLTTGGTLSVADIDTGEAELQPVSAGTLGTNGYGTFEVSAAGVWTYALNNAHASVQALPAGVTLTDTITVLSEDGTASQALTVTITGANDGAVISGTATGNVAEDGTLTTGGTLSVADIDAGEAELQPVSAGTLGTNGYGTFEVSAAGVWTYALNNAHASVQALPAGVTLTDTITVLSEDGTASQALTVTITGANDGAVISGTATGNVAEDGTLTTGGTLSVADIDAGEAELQPVSAGTLGTNGYGTFEVSAAGVWTYALNNAHASVQALPAGVTLTDTITVLSEDGTASQALTVTITGANDGAVISGTATGNVAEDGTLTTGGTLSVADIDTGEAELQPVSAGTLGTNGYGTFEVSAAGVWTYALNNAHASVQALPAGVTLTDTITVLSEDGTASQALTVTITGANDGAVISGTATGNVAEDGTLTTGGTLSVADIDAGEAELQPVSAGTLGTNGYGTFEVSAAGVWTYALNNAHASVQALPAGVTLTDTITVLSEDGTASQALTVTITGANDGAVISGTATGNVAEDGTLTTGGTLSVADIDTGEAELQPVAAGTLGTNGYGTFEVSAAGVWTYALNNAHASVQALPAGVTLTDTITVLSEDGTASQALTVTITGTNEPVPLIALDDLNGVSGVRFIGRDTNDSSGFAVSTAGDVNGDGYDDLLIGAYAAEDGGEANQGETYLVFGGASIGVAGALDLGTLDAANGIRIIGRDAGDQSGFSVSSAGDLNGDGFDDLLIGALFAEDGVQSNQGETYVIFGGTTVGAAGVFDLDNLNATNGVRITGRDAGDYSGVSVSFAGDVNGDGFDDALIGAHNAEDSGSDQGETYLVFGGTSVGTGGVFDLDNLSAANGVRIFGRDSGDISGRSVSNAGDVNGDGFDDLLIGAVYAEDAADKQGETYLVFGGTAVGTAGVLNLDNLNGSNGVRIVGRDISDFSGFAVSSAGDVNSDGFDDLLIGAFSAEDGAATTQGETYLVFGGTSIGTGGVLDLDNLNVTSGVRIIGRDAGDQLGISVASAGDVNGDGFDDLLIGADGGEESGTTDEGESYVVFGGNSIGTAGVLNLDDINGINGIRILGRDAGDSSGRFVSSAGDVNGDGYDDLLIGARSAEDGAETSQGETYVVYGAAFNASGSSINLSGGLGAEILIGSFGADTLLGGGGADVIRSGAGDDLLTVSDAAFFRIDGGTGQDTLAAAFNFDLTTISNAAIKGIETLDLSSGGANLLTLGLSDVLDLDGSFNAALEGSGFAGALSHNSLLIMGEAGDSVDLVTPGTSDVGDGGVWANAGSATIGTNTYVVYNFSSVGNLIASVAVDNDVLIL